MDKRWSDRRDLQLGVEIRVSGELLANCSSQNIGLGGACLQFERDPELKLDQDVDLVFHVPSGARSTKYAIQSKVVWIDRQAAGLKFQDYNTSVFRSLQELIHYKAS